MLRADLFRSGHWFPASRTFRIISLTVENVQQTQVTVRWTMSEVCSGQVEYGPTSAYGSTTTEQPIGGGYSEHIQVVTGLSAGTVYHFRTKSISAAGVTVYSGDQVVTTAGSPVVTLRGPRAAPAVPTGSNVFTIPGTIASNGTGDVGPAIAAWLNGLPAGSIALFTSANTEGYAHGVDTPGKTYRLASTGIAQAGRDLTLWGYGTKLLCETAGTAFAHAAISLYPSGKVTVRGFEFAGVNYNAGTVTAHDVGRQSGHAVAIAGSSGAAISVDVYDCWMHHLWSDGIFVAGWGDTDSSPYGFDFGYNHIELTGRYGITINQNDANTAWVHHSVIEDVALSLVGGEDQRLGTDDMRNALIEENDLGTWGWHDTSSWLAMGINWVYDYWAPLPNIDDCGPITIRDNTWTGGCAPAMFARMGTNTMFISMRDVQVSASDYHDFSVIDNDWTGVPSAQRTVAYWARIHNVRNVTLTGNTGLGSMASRYTTTGSTGVSVSGNS